MAKSALQVWGVTGPVGAGKSLALSLLAGRGYPVADADQASRVVVDPGSAEGRRGIQAVLDHFGQGLLDPSTHGLKRRELRQLISQDAAARKALEKILHPLIVRHLENLIATWQADAAETPLAFIEGTRLIESGVLARLNGLIVVQAAEALRLQRLMARDGVSVEEARALMATQDEKAMAAQAQVIWQNDGVAAHLEVQIQAFLDSRGKS